MEQFNVIFRAP